MMCIQSRSHRALAFAHDVELRLNPWYGRPRTRVVNESDFALPASSENAGIYLTSATWRGGFGDNGCAERPGDGISGQDGGGDSENRQRHRERGVSLATKKKDDLLACG